MFLLLLLQQQQLLLLPSPLRATPRNMPSPRPPARALAAALLALLPSTLARNNLALTPPMGFMTWQLFRCNGPGANGPTDDCSDPATTYCISDALIRGQAAAMHARGFVAAGYTTASIDDCWMQGRNATTGQLEAFRQGFPSGTLAPTAAAVHALGMQLGTYTAESRGTCCGHEASQGYEAVDAATFAQWGVDYLKVRCALAQPGGLRARSAKRHHPPHWLPPANPAG